MTFGTQIKQIRTAHKLTQDELAHVLGYSGKGVIYRWESGRRVPHPYRQRGILDRLEEELEQSE